MNRVLTIALAGVLLLALAVPAAAQYGTGGQPPDEQLPPAQVEDALAGGTTPCSTILISSSSWGPDTQVTVIRNDPGDPGADQSDCDEGEEIVTGLTGTEGTGGPAFAESVDAPALPNATGSSSDATVLGSGTADARGVLSLTIRVPADAPPGAFGYTLVGTASSGDVREVVETITVAPLNYDLTAVDAARVVPTAGGLAVWQLLVALMLVVAVAFVLFGPPRLRRLRG